MQRRALPKSLHFQKANPHIDFDALRVRVQTALEPWESRDGRLLAGVSSFGFGGTNSHAILEGRVEDAPSLFVLSTESAESLRERAGETAHALLDVNGASLEQACARAARETTESFRLATVVSSQEELAERLGAFAAGRDVPGVVCGRAKERPRVALLFTGQGAQYAGMGRGLYEREPAFRAALDRSCALFAAELERPLLAVMWPEPGSKDEGLLDRTGYTQPALFALEFALAELWRSRGVEPQVVSGHSIGEIAAACVAGILSLPDAVRLVAARGRLMEALPEGGAMVAIAADEARVAERIRSVCDRVAIAAVNSRSNVVISGARDPVLAVADSFAAEGIKTRRLTVSHAFHSPLMAPMRDAFGDLARSLRYRRARIPVVSNVDGRRAEGTLGADHWVRHVGEPVRFADGAAALQAEGSAVLLEVGPHPVLLDLASDVPGFESTRVASLTRGSDDAATMLAALGRLFVTGVPVRLAPEEADSARLFVVSGKGEAALRAQCERLDAHLARNPGQALRDVAYSLANARSAFEHRAAIVARTRDELRSKLRTIESGEVRRTRGSVAFVFSGQGSQAIGMGRELHAGWPAFRDALDEVLDLLDAQLPRPLREVMWAEPGTAQAQLLDQTGYTQPALFAVQHALAGLWKSWGVEPALVAGHSIGEVTAACVSGVLSLEDAARLVCARGRLMQELPEGGTMLSVAAAEGEVAKWLAGTSAVEIAAVNGPSQVVVAGPVPAIETLQKQLADAGVRTKRLAVSHAFHSAQMDAMLGAFTEVAKTVRYAPARLPLVSNVSGELAGPEISTPEYWVRHVRQPVRFADGVRASSRAGAGIYLEVGPRATLLGLLPQDALLLPSLRSGSGETESMLAGLGAFWKAGGDVKWPGVLFDGGKRVDLPTYAWQRQRYWVEAPRSRLQGEATAHPLLGVRMPAAGRAGVETVFGLEPTLLQDHRVFGRALVPARRSRSSRAAGEHATGHPVTLRGLLLQSPVVLNEGEDLRVQVVVGEGGEVEIHSQPSKSRAGDAWRLHATAALAEATRPPGAVDLDAVRARCRETLEPGGLYARFQQMGLDHGPRFHGLRGVRRGNGEALAEIHFDEEDWESGISPMVLDAAIQAAIAAGEDRSELELPFELRSLTVHGGAPAFAHVRRNRDTSDVALLDAAGNCVAEVEALRLLRAEREKLGESTTGEGFLSGLVAGASAFHPPPDAKSAGCSWGWTSRTYCPASASASKS